MVKVTLPLLSVSASGRIGTMAVYRSDGVVTPHVVPRDPATAAQHLERWIMGDIAKELHQVSFSKRKDIRYALGLPRVKYDRNWIAGITQFLMLNDNGQFDAGYNAWIAMDATYKSQWAMYDPGRNLQLSSGGVFFAVALGTYNLCWRDSGRGVIPLPMPENALEVSEAWNE